MDDIFDLTHFLHKWAKGAPINLINIFPRTSRVRNAIINILNEFLYRLSCQCKFIRYISTETDRSLYCKAGFRRNEFFSNSGDDNVHMNISGVERLGKHLKYLAHQTFKC